MCGGDRVMSGSDSKTPCDRIANVHLALASTPTFPGIGNGFALQSFSGKAARAGLFSCRCGHSLTPGMPQVLVSAYPQQLPVNWVALT